MQLDLLLLALIAVLWGYVEQHVYRQGYQDKTFHLFGKLSVRYHLPTWGMWAAINYLAGYWWFTPAFAMIEDMSYFFFDPTDELDKDDWINMGLGGVSISGVWIPTMYIIAIAVTVVLFLIK